MTARARSIPLNSKASTTTEVIMWLGLVAVAGIGLYWFIFHFSNSQYLFETVNNDVLFLSSKINTHCDDNYHLFAYNPKTEKGFLKADKNELCIRNDSFEKCVLLSCGPISDANIDLAAITEIVGERDGNLIVYGQ